MFNFQRGQLIFKIWLFLHVFTLITSIQALLNNFKANPNFFWFFVSSTLLYSLTTYLSTIQNPSNPNISLFKRLVLDFSFHILICNIVYYPYPSTTWFLVIGFGSLFQLSNYYMRSFYRNNNGLLDVAVNKIYNVFSRPGAYQSIELSLFLQIGLRERGFIRLQKMIFTLFWYTLYRYATDRTHQMLWAEIHQKIISFQLPGIILQAVNYCCNLGTYAFKMYS